MENKNNIFGDLGSLNQKKQKEIKMKVEKAIPSKELTQTIKVVNTSGLDVKIKTSTTMIGFRVPESIIEITDELYEEFLKTNPKVKKTNIYLAIFKKGISSML